MTENSRSIFKRSKFQRVKHMIITGTDAKELEKAAMSVLQLIPFKYSRKLGVKINTVYLGKLREVAYLKMIWFDLVEDEKHIMRLTKDIELFNEDVAIIFTCQKPCIALQKDDRFNIIQLTA